MYITGRGRGGERCYPERDLEQYSCSTTWEGGGGRRQTGPRSSQGAAEMFAAPLASRNTWRARVPRLLLDDARRAPAPSPPPQSCAFAGFAREFVDRRSAARARSEGAARAEGRVSPAASAGPLLPFQERADCFVRFVLCSLLSFEKEAGVPHWRVRDSCFLFKSFQKIPILRPLFSFAKIPYKTSCKHFCSFSEGRVSSAASAGPLSNKLQASQ